MPSSNLNMAIDAVVLAEALAPKTILDIGPGNGKFGLLMREYLHYDIERLDCIEAEPTYIERFRWLHCIYDNVYQGDALDMTEEELAPYELVMMHDVIEHMEKKAALRLLDRIRGAVTILTPEKFFTQHVPGVPSEDHVSHWLPKDFADTGRQVKCYTKLGGIVALLGPKS